MQNSRDLAYGAVGVTNTCDSLLSLPYCAVGGGVVGGDRVVVKKESTATLMRKQQLRQQASLASVYERNLALARAVSVKGQENTEQAAVVDLLADEVAALSSIHEPIKGRAGMYSRASMFQNTLTMAYHKLYWVIQFAAVSHGSAEHILPFCTALHMIIGMTGATANAVCSFAGEQKNRLDAAMRQSHAMHVLHEICHQQQCDIDLMQHEIARWVQRSKASFVGHRPTQTDIVHSV